MAEKMRTPTNKDMENAAMWLEEAQYQLGNREYHRVKKLCNQVIRALRRKNHEMKNGQSELRAS